MKLLSRFIAIGGVIACTSFHLAAWTPPSFYKYQIGISGGFGSNTAPKMKLGTHLAVNARVNHHAFGFRIEDYGDIAIFQTSSYMNMRGLHYGWSGTGEFAQWQVTGGVGVVDYQYNHGSWVQFGTGPYAELAVSGLVNGRGNGVGVKFTGNINPLEGFFSATVFLELGWAWNPLAEKDITKGEDTKAGF